MLLRRAFARIYKESLQRIKNKISDFEGPGSKIDKIVLIFQLSNKQNKFRYE